VTGRDISKFVCREFEEIRRETKHIIDLQLKRRASLARSGADNTLTPQTPPALSSALSRAGYATATSDSRSGATEPQAKGRRWTVVIAAVALSALAGSAVRLATQPRIPSTAGVGAPTVAAALVPTEAPVTVPPPPPAIAASTTNVGAEGAPPLGSSGTSDPSERATASAPAAPRFNASGGRKGRLPAGPAIPATSTPAPSAAKSPKPGCEPPYTIDAEGNKHLKIECL
jgi:serine/threonine-protein kinase